MCSICIALAHRPEAKDLLGQIGDAAGQVKVIGSQVLHQVVHGLAVVDPQCLVQPVVARHG